MSQPVNNGTSLGHIIVPISTNQSPLTNKGNNQKYVQNVPKFGCGQTIGPAVIPNQPVSEHKSAYSATTPPVLSQSANKHSLINMSAGNRTHDLSNSSSPSTRPNVSIHKETITVQDLNTTLCSNEISLSTCILISDSSYSPSILTSKPIVPFLENNQPMITKSKNGKSKPKVYMAHTKSKPTSIKQALNKPKWEMAIRNEFNALQANKTWILTTLPPNGKVMGYK
ncbi:hypothetical protein KIW84_053222 [Lathyrus oleraceus]|uniref:Uncharacterized protein n=1 Tax=Pisum sativum TaxID=3888 RepID=A0A9D5AGH2_PEA|nr:hypothetical protein KIW84_053222 [Pisum sativum]